jgi:hypothetical protein
MILQKVELLLKECPQLQGRSKGGGQVGPAHPRIFLAHPRIKVKHLLKTRYICNNLKKESNTKALNGMIKILEKFGVYSVIISIFFHRLNLIYVDLCLWSVSSGGLKVVFCSTLPEFENVLLRERILINVTTCQNEPSS